MGNMTFEPIEAAFGARVRGVKVAEMDDEAFAELYDQWLEFGLLIFPDQHLDREQRLPLRSALVILNSTTPRSATCGRTARCGPTMAPMT